MMSLYEAMLSANSTNPMKVKSEIISIKTFRGLQEYYDIDEFGDCSREYHSFKIIDGVQTEFPVN